MAQLKKMRAWQWWTVAGAIVVAAVLGARSRTVIIRNERSEAVRVDATFGSVAARRVEVPAGGLQLVALDGFVNSDSCLTLYEEDVVVLRCGYEDGLIAHDYVVWIADGALADNAHCEQLPGSPLLMRLLQQ